jgi:hypothetical protein
MLFTVMRSMGAPSGSGIVSVTITSFSGLAAIRSSAVPEKTPCVAQEYTSRAPSATRASTASMSEPAVSISSSMITAVLPATSPMTFMSSVRSSLPRRRFSTIASGARSFSAKFRAFFAKPSSLTTTTSGSSLAWM